MPLMTENNKTKWQLSLSPDLVVGTLVTLPWLWLCARYWHYYPLWDAAIYYECAVDAAKVTVSPLGFNCAGHPTMGYLWLPGVLTRIFGASYRVFLLYNVVLGWAMAVAVARMARRLLKGRCGQIEHLLVVGAVMYCPVIATSVLQLTPDFGVLVFLTLSAGAFMRERLVRAIGWGILAALSKESGALLFAVEWAVYVVVYGLRAPSTPIDKVRAISRRALLVLIPLVGILAGGAVFLGKPNRGPWASDLEGIVRQFMTISFMDNGMPASLATIFVLNCMWIPALILFAQLGVWLVRRALLALPPTLRQDPAFEFAVAVFILEVLLLTRFRTFTNVRYYLPVFPWMVLLAARALVQLGSSRPLRVAVQGVTLCALGWSNFRSFDPVSAEIFGTMRFGEHRLFRITSLTKECCGLGRDQLVYNFEFTELDFLFRKALPFVLASKEHRVAVNPESDWKLFDSVEPKSFRRVTPHPGTFKIPYVTTWGVAGAVVKPEKIFYIAMPNMPDTTELVRYGAWYDVNWRKRRFWHNGYGIDVHELVRR